MKDKDLQIDRTCHVIYSKACKREIRKKIAAHYPPVEREAVWELVRKQYAEFLSDWRRDLGGRKNFHNGRGGNYDCIALMAYYAVNGAREFLTGFWQLFAILSVMNLIDRFAVDEWWVGHTSAWTIPGTEDLKPYITAHDKCVKWLFGTLGMALISAVLAGIMTLFVR